MFLKKKYFDLAHKCPETDYNLSLEMFDDTGLFSCGSSLHPLTPMNTPHLPAPKFYPKAKG